MESLFNEKTKKLQKKRDDIMSTRDDLDAIQRQKKVLQATITMNKQAADPIKFIMEKNKVMELQKSVKNWVRKIEIAELEAKKAR